MCKHVIKCLKPTLSYLKILCVCVSQTNKNIYESVNTQLPSEGKKERMKLGWCEQGP